MSLRICRSVYTDLPIMGDFLWTTGVDNGNHRETREMTRETRQTL